MANNIEHTETDKKSVGKYIRKNGLTVLLGMSVVVMTVSPDAKSWVLKQLMVTGIFNAEITKKSSDEIVPYFDFQDQNGDVINTSSLRGKVVFINFWASWCPPCRAELPSIISLYNKFKDDPNIFFLIVNEDGSLSTAKAFLEKKNYTLSLFRTHGNVPEVIYKGTLPTTVVLDKTGKIRYHHAGFANYGSVAFVNQIEKLIKE